MGLGNVIKKAVAPINKVVNKAPGMAAAGAAINKVPGMGAMGRGLGIGPTKPPSTVGQPMGPIDGPTTIGQPMNQAIRPGMGQALGQMKSMYGAQPNPNAGAMGQMAQGAAQMMPQLQPKPMPPDMSGQMGQGNPQEMQAMQQAKARQAQMAQQQGMMGGGLGPSMMRPPMMGQGRGQFGAYRQQ